MFAKKSYGQHFLRDTSAINTIVSATDPASVDLVVEAGPGLGALTDCLAPLAKRLVLIEADRELIPGLEKKFSTAEIVQGDAAVVDYAVMADDLRWVFVSNLPYNAASAIIMAVLSCDKPPERLVVMVQREVGERMLAAPGDMSLLGVAIQMYAQVKRVLLVKPGAFVPPPKVDSMVVQLTPKAYADAPNREDIIGLAKIGFANRRKQLHRNLADAGYAASDKVKQHLRDLGLSEQARAQELSLEHWMTLWCKLKGAS
ncbi:MAG: 16S rRNA (adenine(1518)-N(6)/adenine(1519)-N(6))-dimethyltransferase RsmA [Candidatus Uhrbacteria bacterium]|nr:16S rRNA (adenine(1518)-N(6)/adenine(1519)-N(6))-dimethyltransferase RsmA [Candidatus Uhrbacteria bacterium]